MRGDASDITDEELSGPVIDRRTTLQILGASGALSLAGCAGGGGGGEQPDGNGGGDQNGETTTNTTEDTVKPSKRKVGGTIDAGWGTDQVDNLDPITNSVAFQEQVSMNVFNGLLRATPTFELVGDAAKDWTVKDGKTTIVFELREDMQFHHGFGEVTAEDVKHTIKRGRNEPKTTVANKLTRLKPVDEGGVRVIDDKTVEFNLTDPFVPIFRSVTRSAQGCQIHPKEAIEERGKDFQLHPVGSGPFAVTKHKVGSELVLSAHDGYWRTDDAGNQLPYIDKVHIKPTPEPATLINALRSGTFDFVNAIPRQNLNTIRKTDGIVAKRGPSGGWIGLIMNSRREPFKQAKSRRGIAKLFDSEQFNKQAFLGNNDGAIGPIPPAQGPFYREQEDKPDWQKYDPERGKELLKETGNLDASFEIMVTKGDARDGRVMKTLLEKANPKLDVEVRPVSSSYFWSNYSKDGDFDILMTGSALNVTAEGPIYPFFKSPDEGGAFNIYDYSNEEVDRLLEEQRSTFDQEKRVELIRKAEDLVMKEAPIAFAFHTVPWHVHSDAIQNYDPHPLLRNFESIWLEDG